MVSTVARNGGICILIGCYMTVWWYTCTCTKFKVVLGGGVDETPIGF